MSIPSPDNKAITTPCRIKWAIVDLTDKTRGLHTGPKPIQDHFPKAKAQEQKEIDDIWEQVNRRQ